MPKQTIRDLDVTGKKVLVRVDFNVPQTKDGEVSDDRRIRAALPTLNDVLDQGASLILVSHLGRPTGDPAADAPFRMDTVAARLQELIGRPVKKVDDTVGPEAQAAAAALKPGEIARPRERPVQQGREEGRPGLRRRSWPGWPTPTSTTPSAPATATRPRWSPSPRASRPSAGRSASWSRRSCRSSTPCSAIPKTPMVAVMGGAKVSDKILIIENLLPKVDNLLIGGAMTYTFLKAQGHAIGKSRCEADKLDEASKLLEQAGAQARPARRPPRRRPPPTRPAETKVVDGSDIPDGWFGMDIGPKTIAALRRDHQEGRDRRLERPDGQVRGRAVPPRDARASPRRWPPRRASRPSAAARRPRRSRSSASPTR